MPLHKQKENTSHSVFARGVYGQKSCHDKRHLDIGYERPDITFQSVILLS